MVVNHPQTCLQAYKKWPNKSKFKPKKIYIYIFFVHLHEYKFKCFAISRKNHIPRDNYP